MDESKSYIHQMQLQQKDEKRERARYSFICCFFHFFLPQRYKVYSSLFIFPSGAHFHVQCRFIYLVHISPPSALLLVKGTFPFPVHKAHAHLFFSSAHFSISAHFLSSAYALVHCTFSVIYIFFFSSGLFKNCSSHFCVQCIFIYLVQFFCVMCIFTCISQVHISLPSAH